MLIASVSGASLRLGGRDVVKGVSLDLHAGEVVALVGPNGAGKSSLLRLIAGDARPDQGRISVCGRPLEGWSRAALARCRSVVPQDTQLDFAFTVLEVVLIGRSPHGTGRDENRRARNIALDCLERVGASHLTSRFYPSLSGGERQRVQIARALAQIDGIGAEGGRCLLLDEHTSNLDPAHQHGMFQLAREVAAEGVGVIAVVHDLNLAAAYGDRIGVLDRGELVAFGPPELVLTPAVIGQVFGLACVTLRNPLTGALALATAPLPPNPIQEGLRA
ncbi:heme ABC transporter ATP-binding protein [Magnetospirillum sp. SS-4]|uniref:heme ABC transporter ATP-binding protein n=1 Tax=Magnetospirillum sp. SS-4 TaxID=2681465 RepID=UPI0013856D49|nr:heme ABC transporter ATP-binding protein [Magnetospirillum sp. SS-4]CAA7620100.1 Hemin import ATP-binding protein HmuV [Magnetospirillum sp. SS-4]